MKSYAQKKKTIKQVVTLILDMSVAKRTVFLKLSNAVTDIANASSIYTSHSDFVHYLANKDVILTKLFN